MRIAPQRAAAYHELTAPVRSGGRPAREWRSLPYDQLLAGHDDLVDRMAELIAGAPAARRGLDHVSATARTAALRALWLDAAFELDGATVLCVGDHDLTSLALHGVNPRARVVVVDVDDGVLGHVEDRSGGAVRCVWADLRFGLPGTLHAAADLVVTDPPYTPEGVRLFLTRGLQGLRPHDQTRLVMAYGFGEQPALGVKVQQAVSGLDLAYEAILPGFNRYDGAQALGSSSDLHVLRPTARSARVAASAKSTVELGIYTHGGQSLEGGADAGLGELAAPLLAAARGPGGLELTAVAGPGWSGREGAAVIPLGELLAGDEPPPALRRAQAGPAALAIDLRADPGGWLPRVLLAVGATRVAILVPNAHPDLVDERAQRALAALVGAKYRLRLRRSTPGPRLAIVEADRADAADPGELAVRGVLDRAHGKVANTWRESLIAATGATMSRNEARERIRTHDTAAVLESRLITLPRHRLAALLPAIAASAGD
jgi:hypothetical protein